MKISLRKYFYVDGDALRKTYIYAYVCREKKGLGSITFSQPQKKSLQKIYKRKVVELKIK